MPQAGASFYLGLQFTLHIFLSAGFQVLGLSVPFLPLILCVGVPATLLFLLPLGALLRPVGMMLPGCVGVIRAMLACAHQFSTGVSTSKRSAGADKNTVFSKHLGPLYALLRNMSHGPLYSWSYFRSRPIRLTFCDLTN